MKQEDQLENQHTKDQHSDNAQDLSVSSGYAGSEVPSENRRESERIQEADRAAVPSYELHTEAAPKLKGDFDPKAGGDTSPRENTDSLIGDDSEEQPGSAARPPADPDETARFGAEMGGITNLSLEQLKKERGPSNLNEDTDPER